MSGPFWATRRGAAVGGLAGSLAAAAAFACGSSAWAADKPPALLEPYGGFDVVFGPSGPRVLAPDAAAAVEAMLTAGGRDFAGDAAGCALGDVRLEPTRLLVEVVCADGKVAIALDARQPGHDLGVAGSVWFLARSPQAWAQPCDAPCTARRQAVMTQLLARVAAREGTIPWQRVRPPPGSRADGFLTALMDAHLALSTRDDPGTTAALSKARALRPVADLSASELFDLAILAKGAGDADTLRWALEALQKALAVRAQPTQAGFAGPDAADLRAISAAYAALAGDPTATAQKAQACASPPGCDMLPAVRALAAARAFAQAARVLDDGPLKAKTPRQDLLKLRFGLASAQNDAQGEQDAARRMIELHPDSPEGYDVLAAGLARAGQYRKAIETLHEQTQKHPERDIVLGRIAGLINFLTDEAGRDPAKKADLEAVEARMRAAAADPKDIVARFIVATRAYYAGRLEEALPQLQALAQTDNRDPRIPLYTAMAHFWLGHQQEAQKLIQHAVEIGPSDPDVFYCRSQIARSVNLPLAIADLERYEAMTTQPWSIGPKQKADRVKAELTFMRRGELPPDWDKPGPERVPFQPAQQQGRKVSEDVRLGRFWLPGAVTPTDAPSGATPTDMGRSLSAAPGQDPAHRDGRDGDGQDTMPWWPLTLVVSLLVAVGVRLWSQRGTRQ